MDTLITIQEKAMFVMNHCGDVFIDWVVNYVPPLLMMMIILNTIVYTLGSKSIHRLMPLAEKSSIFRYLALPFFGSVILGNPLSLALGKYLPEKFKPAFFASTSFFCHTSSGVFSQINPAEILVWVGISTGISQLGYSTVPLAIRYMVVGMGANFISGFVTEKITEHLSKSKNIALSAHYEDNNDSGAQSDLQQLDSKENLVKITRGYAGYGGPLIVGPSQNRNKIIYFVGGDKPELIRKIEKLTGSKAYNGYKDAIDESEIFLAIVDCGGTLRCGLFPKKGIPTVNIMPAGKSGPLAKYINEDIYVSDVSIDNVVSLDNNLYIKTNSKMSPSKILSSIEFQFSRILNNLFKASKDSLDVIMKTVLPLVAAVSCIVGIIEATGINSIIANGLKPFIDTPMGLVLIGTIASIPLIAPLLSPGAVMAQVVGVLIGVQIGAGVMAPSLALPALFAINTQAACDFIPVGLGLAEAKKDTIEVGVPAVLYSRFLTGFIRVLIALVASYNLYP